MRILLSFALGTGLAASAWSQTIVEHAVISGAAATGTAGAAGVGKSVGNIFNNVNKALESAGKSGASAAPAPSTPAAAAVVQPQTVASAAAQEKPFMPQPVDPAQITVGMAREDLLKTCGKPSMKISQTKNSVLAETFWYETSAQDLVVVTLRDGKVATVKTPASAAVAR